MPTPYALLLKLTDADRAGLFAIRDAVGVPVSEQIRRAIRAYLDAHSHEAAGPDHRRGRRRPGRPVVPAAGSGPLFQPVVADVASAQKRTSRPAAGRVLRPRAARAKKSV